MDICSFNRWAQAALLSRHSSYKVSRISPHMHVIKMVGLMIEAKAAQQIQQQLRALQASRAGSHTMPPSMGMQNAFLRVLPTVF